jgi:hypothetical protein
MSSLEVNRRGFLGSMIGLLAMKRIPFIAEEVLLLSRPLSMDERVSFLMNNNVRMAIDISINGQREWIEGKILQIERNNDLITVIHEPVIAYQDMTTFGTKLMTMEGREMFHGNWESPQWLREQDTLKPSYSIQLK